MIVLALVKTVSSRVFMEDDEDEELVWAEDIVILLLLCAGRLAELCCGEDCTLGAGEATPRATSWSGYNQCASLWKSSKGCALPQVRG